MERGIVVEIVPVQPTQVEVENSWLPRLLDNLGGVGKRFL